ncbi:MAG: hypothetical protein PHT07_24395 [Paludibacter sp.]|nr:hypothetical protein [Paludibacter sp.]
MTDVAMEISVSLGLDGEITKDVIHVAEEVFRVHRVENPKDKALQTIRIGKLIRELRAEIKRDQELFEQGKLAKRVCAQDIYTGKRWGGK